MRHIGHLLALLLGSILCGCISGKLDNSGSFIQGQANNRISWFAVGNSKKTITANGDVRIEELTRKIYLCTEPTPRVTQDIKDAFATAVSGAQRAGTSGADISAQAQFARNLQVASVVIVDPTEISALRELLYGLCQLSVNINGISDEKNRTQMINLYDKLIDKSASTLIKSSAPNLGQVEPQGPQVPKKADAPADQKSSVAPEPSSPAVTSNAEEPPGLTHSD
jgi:uncharacterized pyridoxamine 5'-phosphate oxidase family protein